MEQLILVRHCQTDLLATGDTGIHRNDSPLSKLGLEQANQIADFLSGYEYDAVFSSLFIRAIKTAEIINTKGKPHFSSMNLNEYFIDDDGKGRETTKAGITRTMSFIYPMFNIYNSAILVGHNSINSTILRSFLNMEFEEAEDYFQKVGETIIIRRDWKKGDKIWHITNKFVPEQK